MTFFLHIDDDFIEIIYYLIVGPWSFGFDLKMFDVLQKWLKTKLIPVAA